MKQCFVGDDEGDDIEILAIARKKKLSSLQIWGNVEQLSKSKVI